MKHFILFYEIVCLASGLPVFALIMANYIKNKSALQKYLLAYILMVSAQLAFANILYYREINILYPVTYTHLLLTLAYFISEASFIYIGPVLTALMLKLEYRRRNKIFLLTALLSIVVIVSPYFLKLNPVDRAMTVLPGLIVYRAAFYAVSIYLAAIIIKNYPSVDKRLRIVLIGSLVLIAVSGIETLFCKLVPVIKAPDTMFRLSPLVYLAFNIFLTRYFLNRLTGNSEPAGCPSIDELAAQFKITNREKEVILLLLDGCKNKAIGKKLFITEATVKSHILNIYQKTGVNSRIQLAKAFYRR